MGVPEDLTTLGDQDLIDALDTLREIDDVNMISIPDCMAGLPGVTAANVQQAIITHCEQMADRFGVLDALAPVAGQPLFGTGSVDEQRNGLDTERGYAALYYPWLQVRPAGRGDPVLVPPSGHVCGIFARSDNSKGVHKAPANELVNGALGVQRLMSDVDQGQLNIRGINVLRVFGAGGRVTLWGARTTATNRNWQYVNVRRLFLYCEESIQEGIRWAVFEPNNPSLWKKLKRSISEFLMRSFRDGAFGGATPEDSFYVRIDEALNPESERRLGRLYIEIGIRPSSSSSASASGPAAAKSTKGDGGTVAQTGQRVDPFGNYNFLVEIDGITRAAFHEASGFDSTIDVIEHREGGDNLTPRKLPGMTKHSNIVLKWGITDDVQLYKWHLDAVKGKVQRKNGSIVLLDRLGVEQVRWNFRNAWPSKWDGPDFNAEGNDVAIETLELAHEGVERA